MLIDRVKMYLKIYFAEDLIALNLENNLRNVNMMVEDTGRVRGIAHYGCYYCRLLEFWYFFLRN